MSDPTQPADGAKRPLDLKSRLRTAAPPGAPAGSQLPPPPASVGTLPPPPARPAKVEAPTTESIDAARRLAEEHAREAGPAFEEFSIGGAPDKTPVPVATSAAARVAYVNVPVHELTPEMKKRHRTVLIGISLAAALVAFLLGLAFSSAGAMSKLKENMVFEANEKLASLESQQPNFERMKALAGDLKTFNDKAAGLVKGGGDLTGLEEDVAALIAKVSAFVDAKPAVDPGSIIGTAVYNGPLISTVLAFSLRTQAAATQATALLEEARTLVGMWRPVPPEQQTLLVFVDPSERDHPEFGKVPMGKGRVIKEFGKVAKADAKAPDGRPIQEFQQMVVLEGDKDPIQVKTAQVAQTDFGPFFNTQLALTKNVSIARLVDLSGRLQKTLEACSPESTLSEIRKFLGAAGDGEAPAVAPAAEAPPAE